MGAGNANRGVKTQLVNDFPGCRKENGSHWLPFVIYELEILELRLSGRRLRFHLLILCHHRIHFLFLALEIQF